VATKKPKFTLDDGFNSIMEGVAVTQTLPQVRTISLNLLWVAPQPRRLLGALEPYRLSNIDNPDDAAEQWLVRLSDFYEQLMLAIDIKATDIVINDVPVLRANLGELNDLAMTIREHGVLQPILVRELEGGERYIITDGHRRALASIIAGKDEIEAKIKKEWTPTEVLSEQLVANIQRKDFTALELTRAIVQLRTLFEQELKTQNPRMHPNELRSKVWELLEIRLGMGKRQLQRLSHLTNLPESIWEEAATMPERRLRPLFKLHPDDQPYAIKIMAQNDASTGVVETLVERRLNGISFKAIAADLGLRLPPPTASSKEVSRETVMSNSLSAEKPDTTLTETPVFGATPSIGVLPALKRLPRNPTPLLLQLETELKNLNERERRNRLSQIEQLEIQAQSLAQHLAAIRQRYT
jgi:hypothetical protein